MLLGKLADPQFQGALRKLAAQDMPLKTAFKLKGIIKRTNDELSKYEEVRGEVLKRLGDKNEDGSLAIDANGTVKLSNENMQTFVNELNALMATDVETGSISVNDLGDKLSLTAQEMMSLDSLITE